MLTLFSAQKGKSFLQVGSRAAIMGILNVTPDSFYDGGRYQEELAWQQRSRDLITEGADVIDIGGESSKPGSAPVSPEEEVERVVPVIHWIRKEFGSEPWISVDTTKQVVAQAAIESGADFVNDISGGTFDPLLLEYVARVKCSIILNHIRGVPSTMQQGEIQYDSVVDDILVFHRRQIETCQKLGVSLDHIMVDPGYGFGKTVAHNVELIAELDRWHTLGCAVAIGVSRKSSLGMLLQQMDHLEQPVPAEGRLFASLGAQVAVRLHGADLIRTHDVRATRESLCLVEVMMRETRQPVAIALGSNVGEREKYLAQALERLRLVIPDLRISTIIETEPFGVVDQPRFLNAVAVGTTSLSAEVLLAQLKGIEVLVGRKKRKRWGPREIDLDLLYLGDQVIKTDVLTLPHPGLIERKFVLEPLAELTPEWRHPVSGKTVKEMLKKLQSI